MKSLVTLATVVVLEAGFLASVAIPPVPAAGLGPAEVAATRGLPAAARPVQAASALPASPARG